MENYCRDGQATDGNITWRMRLAYRITKARIHTHTHSYYLILIIVNSSTKYFAAPQHSKASQMLHVQRNPPTLSYCQIHLRQQQQKKERIVAFRGQQWSSELATQCGTHCLLFFIVSCTQLWSRRRIGGWESQPYRLQRTI